MVLLLIALLLLPAAMLPKEGFYPVEKVEVEARDAGFPRHARRAVVVIRTGGASPVKALNVKIYEKEGEQKVVHVEYVVVYYSRDYVMADRQVDFDSFEKLWLELSRNRTLYLPNAPEGPKDKPTYNVRIKEVQRENTFSVTGPDVQEDKRYAAVVAAVEGFWSENLKLAQ